MREPTGAERRSLYLKANLTLWTVIGGLLVVLGYYFIAWMAVGREGRRIMDEIDGFRMYLESTQRDDAVRMIPPPQSPDLFEKYLPYAVALDLEDAWAELFTEVLDQAATSGGPGRGYRPPWYHGDHWRSSSCTDFASGLGSALGSAVSSSSTAPGSSSGRSGGGSSGGGGGGGGGGW